jgi:AcrR family transcriptional regulator
MPRTGRRPGTTGTRQRILDSAQHAFAASGFDGATIRGIAREAGVDPALVHHYFGSKQQLFVASMQLPFDPGELKTIIGRGGLDGIGERIMGFAIRVWRQPGLQPILVGVARSAVSDERAAAVLRELLATTLLPAFQDLGVDHPELRAGMVWSQIIGLVLGRFVIGVPGLADADLEELARVYAPLVQAAVTEPMPAIRASASA